MSTFLSGFCQEFARKVIENERKMVRDLSGECWGNWRGSAGVISQMLMGFWLSLCSGGFGFWVVGLRENGLRLSKNSKTEEWGMIF